MAARLVTVHGIGKQVPTYSIGLIRNLINLRRELDFDFRPVFWSDESLMPSWSPLPIKWLGDLALVMFPNYNQPIYEQIKNAAGTSGPTVIVAHSHGVWLTLEALRKYRYDDPIDLLVTMGRDSDRFGGLLFCGRNEVRVKRWLNIYSELDPLSGPIRGINKLWTDTFNEHLELTHTEYWDSREVAKLINDYWPGKAPPDPTLISPFNEALESELQSVVLAYT